VPNYSVERVVRYVRLQDVSKALLPHPLNPHKPIQPDWLAITHEIADSPDPAHSSESFGLYFVTDDGECLGFFVLDSIETAVDRANALAGIRRDDWQACDVELKSDDFDITWADIHR